MAANAVLVLDTAAPTVTWGGQAGASPGEMLQLSYASDEPIAFAALSFNDLVLALAVGPTVLSRQLDLDQEQGEYTVVITDDVGNARVYEDQVVVAGQRPVSVGEPDEFYQHGVTQEATEQRGVSQLGIEQPGISQSGIEQPGVQQPGVD